MEPSNRTPTAPADPPRGPRDRGRNDRERHDRGAGALRFLADLLPVAGGAGGAQVITVCAMLVITRLYAPEHIGPAAFFLSMVAILSSVASLRFDRAIVLSETDQRARDLAWLSLGVALVLCAAIGVLTVLLAPWLADSATLDGLGGWLYLLPVAVWLASAVRVVGELRTRQRAFARLGLARVSGSLGMALGRIGAAVALGGSVGLYLLGGLADMVVQLALLGRPSRHVGDHLRGIDPASLRDTAREFADFPRFSVPTTFLNRLADQLPVLMLTVLFSPEVVGLYALTNRALRSPLDLVNQALRRVVLQRTAAAWNAGRPVRPMFLGVTGGALALGTPPLLGIYLFGPALFGFVFGARWETAGLYAAALVPWMLTSLLMSPCNAIFYAARRLPAWLGLEILSNVLRAAVFAAAWLLAWDVQTTLVTFAWTCSAVHAITLVWSFALCSESGATAPSP